MLHTPPSLTLLFLSRYCCSRTRSPWPPATELHGCHRVKLLLPALLPLGLCMPQLHAHCCPPLLLHHLAIVTAGHARLPPWPRQAELAAVVLLALQAFFAPVECRYASTATRHPFCAPLLATAAAVALSLEQLML